MIIWETGSPFETIFLNDFQNDPDVNKLPDIRPNSVESVTANELNATTIYGRDVKVSCNIQ